MPDKKTNANAPRAMTAQLEGKFSITVEAFNLGDCVDSEFTTETIELFPQRESISIGSSHDGEGFTIDLAPRDALELAKKLMGMCAAYGEDIGACDPCGELFSMEELSNIRGPHGDTTACSRCIGSGSA